MDNYVWGLPETKTPINVTKLVAHCFSDGISLCGKCEQHKSDRLKEITADDIENHKDMVCTECYTKWREK